MNISTLYGLCKMYEKDRQNRELIKQHAIKELENFKNDCTVDNVEFLRNEYSIKIFYYDRNTSKDTYTFIRFCPAIDTVKIDSINIFFNNWNLN